MYESPFYSEKLLDALDSNWREREVSLVTFPAPPAAPSHRVFIAADSWRSDALERGAQFFPVFQAAKFTNRGPAFLFKRKLGGLLRPDNRRGYARAGQVYASDPVYCSTISYENLLEDQGVRYCNNTILEGVSGTTGSSNPASHTVAPGAPFLTLLLLLGRAEPKGLPEDYTLSDDQSVRRYFPEADTYYNAGIDKLFRYLSLSEAAGKVIQGTSWKAPGHLSDGLMNLVRSNLISNERLFRRLSDPLARQEAIDLRDATMLGLGGQHV